MKEHSLLLKGEMVRAILEGRKTQTRCPIVPQPTNFSSKVKKLVCNPPSWQVGDILWVRETLRRKYNQKEMESYITYVADITPVFNKNPKEKFPHLFRPTWCWKRNTLPSIHMPRWASRITLEITDIRVERIQEIGFEDMKTEGFDDPNFNWFGKFWDSIYAKKGHGWKENPWVWVREFKKLEDQNA